MFTAPLSCQCSQGGGPALALSALGVFSFCSSVLTPHAAFRYAVWPTLHEQFRLAAAGAAQLPIGGSQAFRTDCDQQDPVEQEVQKDRHPGRATQLL